MDIFSLFTLLGGLALFLYGMNRMGAGLDKIAGGKLERILEKLTSNPLKAVALGTIVTTVIQSSSATTVMVVGFVNSGIMKLSQAVGIIMGANLGTTTTSWILSLSGLQGDNIFIKLLKPSSFSPILAFIGIILYLSKKERRRDIGGILIGFAILMFGMEAMSGAVKPLADIPEFTNILTLFENPLLGVITGAILTAVIQSSSASVGILQALSITGGITFGAAIPIIMGQNIGTCITALLSGIGASKNAKRAALVHLYFNVIGTVLFLVLFYVLHAFINFSFMGEIVSAVSIAIVHTIFNLFSTAILLPFSKGLEKLAIISLKDNSENTERPLLDERFLATPGFAIEQCKDLTTKMGNLSRDTFLMSLDIISNYDEKKALEIIKYEDQIDHYEDVLGSFLVKLSSRSISKEDSKAVSMMLHCIGDFERISDHAVNVLDVAKEMYEKKISFSSEAQGELTVITDAVKTILTSTIQAFVENDLKLAQKVEPLEEVIDLLRNELKNRHIERLQANECTIELGFIFTDLLTNYERVSDHCSNIAVCVLQINEYKFGTHEYLNEVKHSSEKFFTEEFENNKRRFALPKNISSKIR